MGCTVDKIANMAFPKVSTTAEIGHHHDTFAQHKHEVLNRINEKNVCYKS